MENFDICAVMVVIQWSLRCKKEGLNKGVWGQSPKKKFDISAVVSSNQIDY